MSNEDTELFGKFIYSWTLYYWGNANYPNLYCSVLYLVYLLDYQIFHYLYIFISSWAVK